MVTIVNQHNIYFALRNISDFFSSLSTPVLALTMHLDPKNQTDRAGIVDITPPGFSRKGCESTFLDNL